MSAADVLQYRRTLSVVVVVILALLFAFSSARIDAWNALLPMFEWLETTPFGVIGKTWGAAFAIVEAVHLLSMAVLGGAVLVGDGQLLGVILKDQPISVVQAQCHRVFRWSLVVIVLTGIFMACGVALKIYYLSVFWYKMLALLTGVLFAFLVRRPLVLRAGVASPAVLRLVAVASLMLWFSVAATGRWIGFSG